MVIEIKNKSTGEVTSHDLEEPVYEYLLYLGMYNEYLEEENIILENKLQTPIYERENGEIKYRHLS